MTDTRRFSLARLFTLLGAAWIATGALYKLFAGNPGDLPEPFLNWFGWLASANTLYALAIAVELAVVVLAVLRPKLGWVALVGTFLFFEAILAPLIASGAESCGCLGGTITIPPTVMATIDGVLLLGLLAGRPWKAVGMQPLLPNAVAGLLVVAGVVAPVLMLPDAEKEPTVEEIEAAKRGEGELEYPRYVSFTPSEWIGQLIYDTPLAKWMPTIEELPSHDATWVFWRWTCDHCAAHLQELHANPPMKPTVLIRVKEPQDTDENRQVFVIPQGGMFFHAELPPKTDWLISTPADMELSEGVVTAYRDNIGQ